MNYQQNRAFKNRKSTNLLTSNKLKCYERRVLYDVCHNKSNQLLSSVKGIKHLLKIFWNINCELLSFGSLNN